MPFINTAVHLDPDQVLISVCTATDPSELADAKWIVALGRRTEHDLLAVVPDVDRKGAFTGEFALVHVPTGLRVETSRTLARVHQAATAVADLDWASITDADKASDDFNAAVHARLLGMRTARSAR